MYYKNGPIDSTSIESGASAEEKDSTGFALLQKLEKDQFASQLRN